FAADLYALGVTLYETLCGRLPFPGPDFVAQHLGDPVPSTGLGPAWDAALAQLLAKSPAARFGSIGEARAALGAIADAARVGRARTTTPAPIIEPPPASPAAERWQERAPLGTTGWSELF